MSKYKPYAGVGARNTPDYILRLMESVSKKLAEDGFVLRSGAAAGADTAFEAGCKKVNGKSEIFLPWRNFNNSDSSLVVKKEAFKIAETVHPNWNALSDGARKLQARNSHQLLGYDLNHKSLFVICWTKEAKIIGGTGQAIRLAKKFNIPVFNMADKKVFTKLLKYVDKTEQEL